MELPLHYLGNPPPPPTHLLPFFSPFCSLFWLHEKTITVAQPERLMHKDASSSTSPNKLLDLLPQAQLVEVALPSLLMSQHLLLRHDYQQLLHCISGLCQSDVSAGTNFLLSVEIPTKNKVS